jgi:hypothetical protein
MLVLVDEQDIDESPGVPGAVDKGLREFKPKMLRVDFRRGRRGKEKAEVRVEECSKGVKGVVGVPGESPGLVGGEGGRETDRPRGREASGGFDSTIFPVASTSGTGNNKLG